LFSAFLASISAIAAGNPLILSGGLQMSVRKESEDLRDLLVKREKELTVLREAELDLVRGGAAHAAVNVAPAGAPISPTKPLRW
jgi:hypothetical protein